jgi:hypothetical protein
LVERTKPIDDFITRNKLKVFGSPKQKGVSKVKQQVTSLKNNVGQFSHFISVARQGRATLIF